MKVGNNRSKDQFLQSPLQRLKIYERTRAKNRTGRTAGPLPPFTDSDSSASAPVAATCPRSGRETGRDGTEGCVEMLNGIRLKRLLLLLFYFKHTCLSALFSILWEPTMEFKLGVTQSWEDKISLRVRIRSTSG